MKDSIDLNCDMGEGMLHEAEIMPLIHSANISCGLHAGDAETVARTIRLAKKYGVHVGAHPSFNDRANFGRKEIQLTTSDLYDLVTHQLNWFLKIAHSLDAPITHVKPHGALYNMAARDKAYAECIAAAVQHFNPNCIVYGLSGSHTISAARALGLEVRNEVFADRTYTRAGTLTPRSQPNSLIDNVADLTRQVCRIVEEKTIIATDGTALPVEAETLCLHGDGDNAVLFASVISQLLNKKL